MHAIIPAAGIGSRLLPRTAATPKCLIPVGGRPILQRTLERLWAAKIEQATCVVGYRAAQVQEFIEGLSDVPQVELIYNEAYATTNNIVSLLLTAEKWDNEDAVVVVDSDVLFSQDLLAELISTDGDALVVDTGRPRSEIDMAVELREGHVWHLDKELPVGRTAGEFFGFSRWTPSGGAELLDVVRRMTAAGENGTWYPYAIRRLAKSRQIDVVPATTEQWIEIDTNADLEAAELACGRGVHWAT